MFKIRQSKYRHVFCDQPKQAMCFHGMRVSADVGEHQGIKASTKYWSVSGAGGGGSLVVCRHDRPGRFLDGVSPRVIGHSGSILDHDWNPFDDSMVATGSEDSSIKIWQIPEDWEPTGEDGMPKEGESINDDQCLITLDGHRKKVTLIQWHPSACNILLSTSADNTTKVWDIQEQAVVSSYESSKPTQDIAWDARGEHYAVTTKDKCIRIIDPRTGEETAVIEGAHDGSNAIKVQWLDNDGIEGKIVSTGSNNRNGREMKVWDLKDTSKPLHTEQVDTASGALLPLFDIDSNVIYLCGKGHGQIRPYQYDESKEPHLYKLNDGFRSTTSGKGYCMVPKRGLDIMGCETARIMKVTNSDGIHPLSFIVPRKSEAFQDDLFPPAAAASPAHTAEEWIAGSCQLPKTMCLDPKSKGSGAAASAQSNGGNKPKFVSPKVIKQQNEKMKAHIQALEKQLADAGIAFEPFEF
eukprot:jgi/Psemu1/70315/estExt_Genemark1.C_17830002